MNPGANEVVVDLRTRRRLETMAEVNAVAITLFEKQGVNATTVDDIAQAAGISSRTFFRYFQTKEDAALLGLEAFTEALAGVNLRSRDPAEILLEVEKAFEALLASRIGTDAQSYLAVQRLITREPSMRTAASRHELESAERLRESIRSALEDTDALTARVIIETAFATLRAALSEWAARPDDGSDALTLYRQATARHRAIAR